MLISTPYYRTLGERHLIGCDDEPDFMYGPYDIFCMKTRLYPTVYELYNRDIEIIFRGVHRNNRMEIKIELVEITTITAGPISNKTLNISEKNYKILTDAVNKIVTENSDYCLINKHELYLSSGKYYPKYWFDTILGYIQLPTEYNPFIQPEGIYLSFNRDSDYITAYNEVVKILLDTVDKYYNEGVVYKAGNISEKWKLERLDYEEVQARLFKPMWEDKRFAPYLVDFLIDKIRGDPYIKIKVSDNLVKRHWIAKILTLEGVAFVFDGFYVKVLVDNLEDAQSIVSAVLEAQHMASGKVIIYAINRPEWIDLYIKAANKLFGDVDCLGYQVSTVERPYIFSCVVNINTPSDKLLLTLRELVLKSL